MPISVKGHIYTFASYLNMLGTFGVQALPYCGDLKPHFCKSRFIKGDNVLTNSDEVPKAPNTILGCVLWHYQHASLTL